MGILAVLSEAEQEGYKHMFVEIRTAPTEHNISGACSFMRCTLLQRVIEFKVIPLCVWVGF